MAILRIEPNVQKGLAGVSLRQWHEQTADERIVVDTMPVLAYDTDDFHVVRRTIFRRVGVANVLTDWIFILKKFFHHFFVDDRNAPRIFVFAFVLCEIAAAYQFYAKRLAVTGRNRGE